MNNVTRFGQLPKSANKWQTEYMEGVMLGLTKGATFPLTSVGTNCNALINMGALSSRMSENF